ncbi:MAG: hypothetical protein ACLR5T_01730 [Veillonella sp.]
MIAPINEIIEDFNKRYGTEFTEMDKVILQIEQDFAKDPKWRDYINNNGFKTFKILFDQEFMGVAVKRFKSNEEFFKMLLKDKKLFEDIRDALGSAIYSRVENNVMNYGLPDKMMHGMFELEQPEMIPLVADKDNIK